MAHWAFWLVIQQQDEGDFNRSLAWERLANKVTKCTLFTEINKKDTEEIENVEKVEVPEGNEQDEQGADVSENSLDQESIGNLLLPGSQVATEPGTGAS